MPGHPTTWLHISGYRFLRRRIECALLHGDIRTVNESLRPRMVALTLGCVLAAIGLAGNLLLALLGPHTNLGQAQIVMGRESGALYVRVGDTWHPVLNLASARLIAATAANPQPVPESELQRTKRGPLLGIPGAPQLVAQPLSADESFWTICDSDPGVATTVLVGPLPGAAVRSLPAEQAILVAPGPGSPAYLLYDGRRAVVDLADPAVLRALRLEGRAPHIVSQALLNAVPEAPSITAPRIHGAGARVPAGPPGFPVGSVLRITRGDGDEHYVVLEGGLQRIGQVAADLLRFSDSHGNTNVVAVAPDVVRAAPIVNTLPVSAFPDRAPAPLDDPTVCVTWAPARTGRPTLLAGNGSPLPVGHSPVTLTQADARGPAVDAVYLPPGRSAYVAPQNGTQNGTRNGTRYLVTDTGVRFAIHDDDTARALGLATAAVPAPWPVLATLPTGPELSKEKASVARDTVVAGPPGTR